MHIPFIYEFQEYNTKLCNPFVPGKQAYIINTKTMT
jgi:hypothetical protein